ncbi:uncharacterized protein BX663DRAFT_549799 [Cokeromyces recurvatus]|uniref:uncharacterized protein n=1 Tax=Cokeromyces recurvatus TaxID=90255 RepID=UPI0022211DF3|nr:uncharacterized protein BX663DRAFT_549799 [Cokeromyces recurvatus]KAI7904931.1 hypothetical protein BX663DRAFT_549799 [Cokeromyces recurvatus]
MTVSCNASTPTFKRDMKKNGIINKLSGAQDLIKRLKEMKSFCLVVIDFSGLTTNMDSLIDVMRKLQYIAF